MLLYSLSSLINPNIDLDRLSFDISLAMCEPASFLSLGESCPARGGNVAERLRSMLAYGWVERCSDVAGCGMSSL